MLVEQNDVDLRHRHWEMALSAREPSDVVSAFTALENAVVRESAMDRFMTDVQERRNG